MLHRLKPFLFPLISLCIYVGLAFYVRSILPPGTDIYIEFENLFRHYGYWLLFIAAVVEAALFVNLIIPGGSVILAGVFFASQGVLSYPVAFFVTLVGSLIGFSIDYWVGYHGEAGILNKIGLGSQLKTAETRVKNWGWKAFLFGYIHPDLGSLYAIAAGVLKIEVKRFFYYSVLGITFWGLFWSLPIYIFGDEIKQNFQRYSILAITIIITAIFLPKIVSKIVMYRNRMKGIR